MVRRKVLSPNEPVNDFALTWWALANVPNPPVPHGEFRMAYDEGQAIYYGEVRLTTEKRFQLTTRIHAMNAYSFLLRR